ncbi:Uncharacterised protein [Salmonella enterica subsp. enterica serovar Typhi]|nr:Uncharacterised protein [Salmonella enterica subsp. enterica serovar Typhi]
MPEKDDSLSPRRLPFLGHPLLVQDLLVLFLFRLHRVLVA